jgi:hypothetical protein
MRLMELIGLIVPGAVFSHRATRRIVFLFLYLKFNARGATGSISSLSRIRSNL